MPYLSGRLLPAIAILATLAQLASPPPCLAGEEWGIKVTLSNYYPVVEQGGSTTITVTVTHEGGPPSWHVELSLSPPLPPRGVTVSFSPAQGLIPSPGATLTSTMTISAGEDVEPGVYYLNITAYAHWGEEGYGGAARTWRYWYYVAIPLTVRPRGLPDLAVLNMTYRPPSPRAGDEVVIEALVANLGERDAGPFLVEFTLNDTVIHAELLPGLAAGGTARVSAAWRAVEGTYMLRCVVDPDDRVEEQGYYGGEENNALAVLLRVAKPGFRLVIEPSSRTVRRGESAEFRVYGESLGGFRGYVRLRARALEGGAKLELKLSRDRILVEPRAGMTVAEEEYALLRAETFNDARLGNYTLVVEGEAGGIKAEASCRLEVVSVSIDEVKAFYKLDSFFLAGLNSLLPPGSRLPPNRYYVKASGEVERVEFVVNGRASPGVMEGEHYVSPEYDMSEVSTPLTIRVYGRQGDRVEKTVETHVLPTPLWLRALIAYATSSGALELKVEPGAKFDNVWVLEAGVKLPKEPLEGRADLSWLPIIGGVYGFEAGFQGSTALRSDRVARLMGSGSLKLTVASREAGISITVVGYVVIADTVHLSLLKVDILGYADIPILKVKHMLDLGLFGEIGVDFGLGVYGNVAMSLNATEASSGGDVLEGIRWVEGRGSATLGGRAWGKAALLLSIIVEGDASITVTIFVPRPYWRRGESLKLAASILVAVKIPVLGTYNLIDESVSWPSHHTVRASGWVWIPRLWAGPRYAEYLWAPGAREGLLLNNTYLYPHPSAAAGERVVLVWAHDDLSKPHVRGYEIYYSTWDEERGAWTPPAPLTDDLLAQGDPVAAADGEGRVVCVWGEAPVDEADDPLSTLGRVELAYSVWDPSTGEWSRPRRITSNGGYEMYATIGRSSEGDLMLLWASDRDANLSTPWDWDIYAAPWTGDGWGEPTLVARGVPLHTPSAVVPVPGGAVAAWCQHTDGNFTTLDDVELFYSTYNGSAWSPPIRLTRDEVEDAFTALAERGGRALIASVKRGANDTLVLYEVGGGSEVVAERPRIAWPLVQVDEWGQVLISWLDGLEQTPVLTQLYRGNWTWLGPLKLANTSLLQRDYSWTLASGGRLVLAEVAGPGLQAAGIYTSWRSYLVNTPPSAAFSYAPEQPLVGTEVEFHDETRDPEGVAEWRWDFGDGSASSERSPSHVYAEEGLYRVKLAVVDDAGVRAEAERVVKVVAETSLSLSVEPRLAVRSGVTVRGAIKPPREGLAIRLIYEGPGGEAVEHVVATGPGGEFTDTFSPARPGAWSVRAVWEGDELRLPSEARAGFVFIPWWLMLPAALAAALAVAYLAARRGRRASRGTPQARPGQPC